MISPTTWAVTLAVLAALAAVDLLVSHRRRRAISLRAATAWSAGYVVVALGFGVVLGLTHGWELGEEYFAGYALEKSLSIDNLFVFVMIVAACGVPAVQQPRALSVGLSAALVLRAAFIAVGAVLIDSFTWSFAIFGVILLVAAVHLLRSAGEPPGQAGDRLVSRLRSRLPGTVTPLRLAIVAMVCADGLFALDSIPAIYGVTEHPYVVFCANAFALLGLRALFFLVSGLVARLRHLALGMAAILGVIGVKLVLHAVHAELPAVPTISTGVSLAVIVGVLALATVASLLGDRRRQMGARPHGRRAPAAAR